jgi:hypothetical protein
VGSARATKQLGQAALGFYHDHPVTTAPVRPFRLPPRPSTSQRRRLAAAIPFICLSPIALVMVIAGGPGGLRQHALVTVLGELFLVLTFGRLLWITRPPRSRAPEAPGLDLPREGV